MMSINHISARQLAAVILVIVAVSVGAVPTTAVPTPPCPGGPDADAEAMILSMVRTGQRVLGRMEGNIFSFPPSTNCTAVSDWHIYTNVL